MNPITSDQRRHFNRVVADIGRKSLAATNLDRERLQRLLYRGNQLQMLVQSGIDIGSMENDHWYGDFGIRMAASIRGELFEEIEGHRQAREIMGANFLGLKEAIGLMRINPVPEDLATLHTIPFSEEVLRASRRTHVLVAVFGISIYDLLFSQFGEMTWNGYAEDSNMWNIPFYCAPGKAAWHLIRKDPSPADYRRKMWKEQLAQFPADEEPCETRALVYAMCCNFLKNRESIGDGHTLRCNEEAKDRYGTGTHMTVCCHIYGQRRWADIAVHSHESDRECRDSLGMSAEKKLSR